MWDVMSEPPSLPGGVNAADVFAPACGVAVPIVGAPGTATAAPLGSQDVQGVAVAQTERALRRLDLDVLVSRDVVERRCPERGRPRRWSSLLLRGLRVVVVVFGEPLELGRLDPCPLPG